VWQGLPVPEPERVVRLSLDLAGKFSRKVQGAESRFSYPELMNYREQSRALEAVAGMNHVSVLWRRDTEIRPLAAVRVTGDYFKALRVIPRIGRVLSPGDALQPVVVISHRLWVSQFERDAAVLNRTMVLDRSNYTVVGVLPEEFTGTQIAPVDVWLPLEAALRLAGDASQLSEANTSWLQVIGRLAPAASLTSANAEAAVMAARFDAEYPGRRSTIGIASATLLGTEFLRPHDRGKWIAALTGVAGLTGVLLLVCGSNVAALLLAQGVTRQKEFAVRAALGAGRGRLVQQLVAEVAAIAAVSAVIGLLISQLAIRMIAVRLALPSFKLSFSDPTVVGFVMCFALGVAFFFGLAPARQAMHVDCLGGLKGEGLVFGAQLPATRLRQGLVAIQVAVSVILLVAAALLGRGIGHSVSIDPGYSTKNLYIVQIDSVRALAGGTAAVAGSRNIVADVRDALASEPGVGTVGLCAHSPFRGVGISTAGDLQSSAAVTLRFNNVDGAYFRALGVSPNAGRIFAPHESDVVLVNSSLARQFWGGDQAAIGRLLRIPIPGVAGPRVVTVVGVIPSMQTTDIGVPDEPTYYAPLSDRDQTSAYLLVRAAPDTQAARLVADVVRSIDSDAVATVITLDEQIAVATVPARVGAAVAGLVGVLSLLVAAVGIHGIVAHAVLCRTRDIGVHVALGAPRSRILRLVVGWAMSGVLVGAAVGTALVMTLTISFSKPFRAVLFGLDPLDPFALLTAAALLALVTSTAAYLPARRALRLGPSIALRHE
jgi:predicted permease